MKENSREKDIECIQEFLEYSQDMINDMDYKRPVDVTIYQNQINSLDYILPDYKRILKENEELKADNYELNNRINDLLDNISVQKIKDKIEELNKKIASEENEKVILWLHKQRNVLQDLLEEKGE